VRGAGHPGFTEHLLHLRLVAHVASGALVHPLDPHRLPHLGKWHLELLEGADEALHSAHLATEPAHRLGQLPRIEGVLDAPVPGQPVAQHGRDALERVARDQAQPHAGERGRVGDEPRRRFHEIRRDEDCGDHDRTLVSATASPTGPAGRASD